MQAHSGAAVGRLQVHGLPWCCSVGRWKVNRGGREWTTVHRVHSGLLVGSQFLLVYLTSIDSTVKLHAYYTYAHPRVLLVCAHDRTFE